MEPSFFLTKDTWHGYLDNKVKSLGFGKSIDATLPSSDSTKGDVSKWDASKIFYHKQPCVLWSQCIQHRFKRVEHYSSYYDIICTLVTRITCMLLAKNYVNALDT